VNRSKLEHSPSTTVLKNSALCSSLQVTSEVSDEAKPGIAFCELL
jgi:hypothetical protein